MPMTHFYSGLTEQNRLKLFIFGINLYLCICLPHASALGRDNDILESDTLRFVFGSLNVGNSTSNQRQMQRVTPTGAYMYAAGVCRGLTMPSCTLFGCTTIWPTWVSTLFILLEGASDGLSCRTGRWRYPVFRMLFWLLTPTFWHGYRSEFLLQTYGR